MLLLMRYLPTPLVSHFSSINWFMIMELQPGDFLILLHSLMRPQREHQRLKRSNSKRKRNQEDRKRSTRKTNQRMMKLRISRSNQMNHVDNRPCFFSHSQVGDSMEIEASVVSTPISRQGCLDQTITSIRELLTIVAPLAGEDGRIPLSEFDKLERGHVLLRSIRTSAAYLDQKK